MSTCLEKLSQAAKESGFDQVGVLNVEAIQFDPRVRDMCASGKCGKYGKSWMCPPGCGTLEEMEEKTGLIRRFSENEKSLRHLRHLLTELERRTAGDRDAERLIKEAETTVTGLLMTEDGEDTDGV